MSDAEKVEIILTEIWKGLLSDYRHQNAKKDDTEYSDEEFTQIVQEQDERIIMRYKHRCKDCRYFHSDIASEGSFHCEILDGMEGINITGKSISCCCFEEK